MGGNGAIVIGARNPNLYKSISAFAPVCNPSSSNSTEAASAAFTRYFSDNLETGKLFDCSEVIRK